MRLPCLVLAWLIGLGALQPGARATPVDVAGAPVAMIRLESASGYLRPVAAGKVLYLPEAVTVTQGSVALRVPAAVVWLLADAGGTSILEVYAEGRVSWTGLPSPPTGLPLHVRLSTGRGVELAIRSLTTGDGPPPEAALWNRAQQAHMGKPPEAAAGPGETEVSAPGRIKIVAKGGVLRAPEGDKRDRWMLRGNVDVDLTTQDMRVYADTALIWFERTPDGASGRSTPVELYAEGAVTLISRDQMIRADKVYVDLRTSQGLAINARVQVRDPGSGVSFVFDAPEVRQLDADHLLARNGYASTCTFVRPHYRLSFRELQLMRGRTSATAEGGATPPAAAVDGKTAGWSNPFTAESAVATLRNNVVWIGPAPVLYVPYLSHDIKSGGYFLRDLSFGSSNQFGPFLFTEWNLYDLGLYRNNWSNLLLRLDEYGRRGLATGLNFDYNTTSAFGFFDSYYIEDRQKEDKGGIPIPHDDRGRVLWRHRQLLPADWMADLEFSWLSDPNFMFVYFQQEFEESKAPETLIHLHGNDDNRRYSLLAQTRINDSETVVERLPQFGLDWLAEPWLGDALLWSNHSTLSQLKLSTDERLHVTDPNPTTRFDTRHEVALPLNVGEIQVDPYADGSFTAYSNQAANDAADYRLTGGYGVRAGTTFYRTYEAVWPLLQVNRIRHILSPTIDFHRVEYVSQGPGEFTLYDEVDARDYQEEVTFGLRNRLETKRGSPAAAGKPGAMRAVDFVVLDADYVTYPGDRGSNAEADDRVDLDFRWQTTDNWVLSSRGNEYNVSKGYWRELNGRVDWQYRPDVGLTYEHVYVRRPTAGDPDHSIGKLNVAYEPAASRWRFEFGQAYDFSGERTTPAEEHPRALGTTLALKRMFHDFVLVLTAEFFKGPGDETVIGFRLQPPGGQGNRVPL